MNLKIAFLFIIQKLWLRFSQVWDPKPVEQVPGLELFAPVVQPQLQELNNVRMPRLQVDGVSARTLNRNMEIMYNNIFLVWKLLY
jgi:hypothetical protein